MGIRGKKVDVIQVDMITLRAMEEIDRCFEQLRWLILERKCIELEMYNNYLTLQDQKKLNQIKIELQL